MSRPWPHRQHGSMGSMHRMGVLQFMLQTTSTNTSCLAPPPPPAPLLLLRPAQRRPDQSRCSPQLHPDHALKLRQQLLIRHRPPRLELCNLSAHPPVSMRAQIPSVFSHLLTPSRRSGDDGRLKLTSDGFAFTAVARSFCVMLFPSAFFLSVRACAIAFPTLHIFSPCSFVQHVLGRRTRTICPPSRAVSARPLDRASSYPAQLIRRPSVSSPTSSTWRRVATHAASPSSRCPPPLRPAAPLRHP